MSVDVASFVSGVVVGLVFFAGVIYGVALSLWMDSPRRRDPKTSRSPGVSSDVVGIS